MKKVLIYSQLLILMCITVKAQEPMPLGPEYQANTYTTGEQDKPVLANLGSGKFVVVWETKVGYSHWDLKGRLFTSGGQAVNSEFAVNTLTTGHQQYASAWKVGNGEFVVVWESRDPSPFPLPTNIKAQLFSSDGALIGSEFQVNADTTNISSRPSVSSDGGDGFIVVWSSSAGVEPRAPVPDRIHPHFVIDIRAQRFSSAGDRLGDIFRVNSYTTDEQFGASVSPDGSGGFVVAYTSYGSDDTALSKSAVLEQRFHSDGSANGEAFQITELREYQWSRDVSLDGAGGFVVSWQSYQHSIPFNSLIGQRFGSNGNPIGKEFTFTESFDSRSTFSTSPDKLGGVVATWETRDTSSSDPDGDFVQGRRFDASGLPKGENFQANSYTTGDQVHPVVISLGSKDFVFAWSSRGSLGTDDSSNSIQVREFTIPVVFSDGFESGDLSAWSNAQP